MCFIDESIFDSFQHRNVLDISVYRSTCEFKWNFTKFKEGLKEIKTTWLNAPKGHPRLVGNCLVYVYQFLTSNSNFNTTSNLPIVIISLILWEKLFIPKYTQNHQKIYKKARNVVMWYKHRYFWLFETWMRYIALKL